MDPTFAETRALHLAAALPDELLQVCRQRLADALWSPDSVTGAAFAFDTAELALPELDAFLASDRLDIRALAGLSAEHSFAGSLKRLGPGPDYRFPWHRDHRKGQRLGMTVNLSSSTLSGGVFEQRLRWQLEPTVRIHSQPGDVHIFDVADTRLVHRVTPVTAGLRVVLAGWWT
ncbi:MAG: 2OG-Fe(II) oxygenase [Proteobacteria bacterium]|nr:2OG-Fe(II) oxygenase [Pseudomonadota bacterium]